MADGKGIEPHVPLWDKGERKVTRSIHKSARDVARTVAKTPAYRRTR